MVARFLERFDLDYFLGVMPYTLLDEELLDEEMQLCERHRAKIIIGAVFSSGILATGATAGAQYRYQPAPDDVLDRVRRITTTAARQRRWLPR